MQFESQLCMENSSKIARSRTILPMRWIALFSVINLGLHLARKCETQQTYKQTVKQLPRRQERFTHYMIYWYPWMKPIVRAATRNKATSTDVWIISFKQTAQEQINEYSKTNVLSRLQMTVDNCTGNWHHWNILATIKYRAWY